ncbi:alpha-hydroxy acid oxidase [Streptomyces sp. SLBN-8D4]|uniref:alpha-hydroxy acid oxidase n=1 Tax=Streptomyces sp. SLBN-8D4 TaxID=3377728 RepID=UPI003C7CD86D
MTSPGSGPALEASPLSGPLADAPPGLAGIRSAARAVTDPAVWDFIEGGSGAETALAANRAALDGVALLPRVLTGRTGTDLSGRLLGTDAAMPVAVAPMAYQCLLHPEGERAVARAARAAGVPFVLSTLSSRPLEEVVATEADVWFQLYWLRERSLADELVAHAEDSGCRALMVTVDVPTMGRRWRDVRNGFSLPPHVRAANLGPGLDDLAHRSTPGVSAVADHTRSLFGVPTLRDLERLRRRSSLPLVVKGVLDARDARRVAECGADAVVVSNHGGRQFDGAPPSIAQLPSVAEAVAGLCAVLLDSGIRTGTDVLRALALGASGVLVGRPVLWGLAAHGEKGVAEVLSVLRDELREGLLLTGCADLAAAADLRVRRWAADA